MATCPAINDNGRQKNWKYTNFNCPGSGSFEQCKSNQIQIGTNKSPACAWNGCTLCGEKTQFICSDQYPTDNASLWNCCSGKTSMYDCHSDYCPTSSKCETFLSLNCSGENLFNPSNDKYSLCNAWCSRNSVACNDVKKQYCNNINTIGKPECKIFAKHTANNNDGYFDLTVDAYCNLYPNDLFCSCKVKNNYDVKDHDLLSLLNAPQCYDSNCIDQGYQNNNQISFRKSNNCPTSICSNKISIDDVSNSTISNIVASCNSNAEDAESAELTNNINITQDPIFLLFLIIIVLCGAYIYMPYLQSNKSDASTLLT